MIVEFGWFLDRAPWAFSNPGLNRVRVGRKGFTNLLLTKLGLTRPDTLHAHRVGQYLQRLLSIDSEDKWFHSSLAVDPWSTAAELLEARDDAVSNGWSGDLPAAPLAAAEVSPLLRTLAEVEAANGNLPPALADDIRDLPTALLSPLPLGIDQVILQHAETTFPQIWQDIFSLLKGRGILVSEKAVDGSQPQLHVLTTETEWDAAENVARWLAAGNNANTAMVCSDDTSVLDHYLADRGLPRLGVGEYSSWRANDQIIPLFFEVVWGPINVRLLAEFLALPGTPIKRRAARYLLQALQKAPGVGSEVWHEALKKIADHKDLGPSWASDLDNMFNEHLINGDTAPGTVLVEKATWLLGRLRRLSRSRPALQGTVEQLQQIAGLLSPLPEVSQRDVRRIVSSVITPKSSSIVAPEASPWLRLTHLTELSDDVEYAVWWGFKNAALTPGRRWEAHDVSTLKKVGVSLPAPEDTAALAIQQTTASAAHCKNLILVEVEQAHGARTEGTGLLEALVSAQPTTSPEDAAKPLTDRARELRSTPDQLTTGGGLWDFAGRSAQLLAAPELSPTPPAAIYDVGANPSLKPDQLSFSQLAKLLGCSFAWVMERKSNLQSTNAAAIPTDNTLLGTFAHKVVEILHSQLRDTDRAIPDDAEIQRCINSLMPQYAAELLLPGHQRRREAIAEILVESVRTFFRQLSKGGITLQGVELGFEKDLELVGSQGEYRLAVSGSADAVGLDSEGRTVVIDLKWSNKEKYRREEIASGTALQLALYQWALHEGPDTVDDPTAYYMLKQGSFISADSLFGPSIQRAVQPNALWDSAKKAVEFSIDEVAQGRITATQVADDKRSEGEPSRERAWQDNGLHHIKPPCRFCELGVLCGLKGDFS
ncbi:PD-(D/E)XK nuclease family protein [Paenarthrobacter sp. NCHU4564]|uniref:PD-(D/E)XK nuclease family protein n=1 Tax=Paenarthrobacter sp. NCHU4564 TaxID=3451353 RepID=UPI003F980747